MPFTSQGPAELDVVTDYPPVLQSDGRIRFITRERFGDFLHGGTAIAVTQNHQEYAVKTYLVFISTIIALL